MTNRLHYGEYLDKIADHVESSGESRPKKKDLPRKVSNIVELVMGIEKILSEFGEECGRSELHEKIQLLLENRRILRNLVCDIGRELSRAMGRAMSPKLPIEEILQVIMGMVNSLESIQRAIRSESHERIPLIQLDQHVRHILADYYHKVESSRVILEKISRKIDPTNSEPSNFEDLPLKVAGLVDKQASIRDTITMQRMLNTELMDSQNSRETEGEMRLHINRIDELERSIDQYCRQEETMRKAAKKSNDLLAKTVGEAKQLQTTLDEKQIDIDKMRATETDLRNSQVSLKNTLEEVEQVRNTLKTKQNDIQILQATVNSLKESNVRDLQRAERRTYSAVAEVQRRHGEEIEILKSKHKGELNDQKSASTQNLQALKRQHEADMVTQRESHSKDQEKSESRHHDEKENLQEHHDAELQKQRKYAEALQANLDEEVRQHALSMARAQARIKEHENKRVAIEHRYTQKLAEQQKLYSSAQQRAEVDKIEQLDSLRNEHNRLVRESEKTWELKFVQVVRDHEAEEIGLKEALRLEEARSMRIVEEEEQKYKNVIEKLEVRYQKLEVGYQKLEGILLKQDGYSGLTDLEIVRGVTPETGKVSIVGFTNMVSKVTTFSEWEWREVREIWSNETMAALAGTKQRRLKKLILGDAIWTALFQLIFCSPFRVLGKEGENREADWNGSFLSGDDETNNEYSWPTPTVSSEKYRWETCEAALDSLTKPSSPYGPLRSSFVNHQKQFQEHFLETLEAYVDLTEKRVQDLLKLLTEAARMWIVFCTQRYRIRIILPGSNESDPEKKSRLAKEQDDLKFTVTPRLQRHGNAKGAQLEVVSVISGCGGEVAGVHDF